MKIWLEIYSQDTISSWKYLCPRFTKRASKHHLSTLPTAEWIVPKFQEISSSTENASDKTAYLSILYACEGISITFSVFIKITLKSDAGDSQLTENRYCSQE